ncbi:uncharacterized protein LOC120327960 isoform X2 [Styela clava]
MFYRLLLILVILVLSEARICKSPKTDNSKRCKKSIESGMDFLDTRECLNNKECCEWDGKCYFEIIAKEKLSAIDKGKSIEDKFLKKAKAETEDSDISSRRFLTMGGPCIQPASSPTPIFPNGCEVTRATPYVTDPPVDVPYCVRIPCESGNDELEKDAFACLSRPGCYFDQELFEFRKYMVQQMLPGVPVCHFAIRNRVFQKEAKAYMQRANQPWNPYYTHCLLTKYESEIMAQPDGCNLIPMLEHFGGQAKLAGWKNITPKYCSLIGGCWRYGLGCFYPVDDSVTIKSGETELERPFTTMPHGRPRCQIFSDRGPREILKSMHYCLKAGCKVDPQVVDSYYNLMFEYGKTLNASQHWHLWLSVQEGKTRADNIFEYIPTELNIGFGNLGTIFSSAINNLGMFSNNIEAQPVFPPVPNTNILTLASNTENPLNMGNFHSIPVPNLANLFNGADFEWCGPAFMTQGGRPCKPKTTSIQRPSDCPYTNAVPSSLYWLKPLKGSMKGCCDINLCYLSKSEILEAKSGDAHYYTQWTFWSQCSKTCGGGLKRRHRNCMSSDNSQCSLSLEDVVICNSQQCPIWSEWSPWGQCSSTCVGGTQKAERICFPSEDSCKGNKEKVRSCNDDIKCVEKFGNWGPWSDDCNPCGTMTYRSRVCIVPPCNVDDLEQNRECNYQCGSWENWGSWSRCSYGRNFTCRKIRKRKCILNGQSFRVKCKAGSALEEERCSSCNIFGL